VHLCFICVLHLAINPARSTSISTNSPPLPAVHLCFICVLHLANEHGLVIRSVPELDRLLISNVPQDQRHQ